MNVAWIVLTSRGWTSVEPDSHRWIRTDAVVPEAVGVLHKKLTTKTRSLHGVFIIPRIIISICFYTPLLETSDATLPRTILSSISWRDSTAMRGNSSGLGRQASEQTEVADGRALDAAERFLGPPAHHPTAGSSDTAWPRRGMIERGCGTRLLLAGMYQDGPSNWQGAGEYLRSRRQVLACLVKIRPVQLGGCTDYASW